MLALFAPSARPEGTMEVTISPKRNLQKVFEEAASLERRLEFHGPDPIRLDSRHFIREIAADHVVFNLLGDDILVIPFHAIVNVRMTPTTLQVRYR